MKKMVETGNPEVVRFLEEVFAKSSRKRSWNDEGYFSCPAGCGFICPGLFEEFEVSEEIEIPYEQSIPSGIYRIVHHEGGNTSHYICMEKWDSEKLAWARSVCSNIAWAGDVMPDWRGILRVSVQGELPL